MNNLEDTAESITTRAYSLFPQCHKPSELLSEDEKPFTMYSYERPARLFWFYLSKELLSRGLTDEQVVKWLASKSTKHLLDSHEDKFEELVKEMLNDFIV